MTSPAQSSLLRAADSDRDRAIATLKRHYVDGRLGASELGDRIARALAARTHGDLQDLLGDLPPLADSRGVAASPSAVPTASPPFRWCHPGHALLPHLATYAAVMLLLLAIWLFTTPGGYFWPVWPALGWGVGLLKRAHVSALRGKSAAPRSRAASHATYPPSGSAALLSPGPR